MSAPQKVDSALVKQRLDHLLVERNLARSLSEAQGIIMAGEILVSGQPMTKPGTQLAASAQVERKERACPWVSRGGIKLAHAFKHWSITLPMDAYCLDVGASTGGFTDVLLNAGAKRVYAVDVGYGQLAWKLAQDSRVVVIDRFNIRHLKPSDFAAVDFITMDVSFISLENVLPIAVQVLRPGGAGVALIKPQFELPKHKVGKGGVVWDEKLHAAAIQSVIQVAENMALAVVGITPSPVTGPKGNREFCLYFLKPS